MLDRPQLIACLERATAIALPSQVAVDLLRAPAIGQASGPVDLADLTALARTLGLENRGYISNLEAGRKLPSISLVLAIADLFGVTTDDLLHRTVPPEVSPPD